MWLKYVARRHACKLTNSLCNKCKNSDFNVFDKTSHFLSPKATATPIYIASTYVVIRVLYVTLHVSKLGFITSHVYVNCHSRRISFIGQYSPTTRICPEQEIVYYDTVTH